MVQVCVLRGHFPKHYCNKGTCSGHDLVIVSHRNKCAYAGDQYDLHFFAQQWITDNLGPQGLFNVDSDQPNAYFLE